MKQSRINAFFSPGKPEAGTSGSFMQSRRMNKSEKRTPRDWLYNKDPTVIYEKFRERERKQMKINPGDHMSLECDLSSQNSSQLMFNSQLNSQNSQSFVGNSSYSEDTTGWYQSWMNRNQPATPCYPQSRSSSRQSFPGSSSEDFKQYMDDAKRRSKEKDQKDMLSTFLTLVKECCEETKAAVSSSSEKYDTQLSEKFLNTFEKIENVVKKLDEIENFFKSQKEYDEKMGILERKLCESQSENVRLRQELDDVRKSVEHDMMEKLTEAFEKEKLVQSEKMKELVSCTSEIKSCLKTPKLVTADMWSQCSPRLPLLKPSERFAPGVATQTSPVVAAASKNAGLSGACGVIDKRPNECFASPVHRISGSGFSSPIFHNVTTTFASRGFAAPMFLPPRYAVAGVSRHHNSANQFTAANTLPVHISSVGTGQFEQGPSQFRTQPRNALASPSVNGRRYLREKNWSSPVAAVAPFPQQHGECVIPKPVTVSDGNSATNSANRSSWEDLANNQSQSWFARNTRSKMVPGAGFATAQPVCENTGDRAAAYHDSTERPATTKKPRLRKRKGPSLTRTKGYSKRKPTLKVSSAIGSEDPKRYCGATENEIYHATVSGMNCLIPDNLTPVSLQQVRPALAKICNINACNSPSLFSVGEIKKEWRGAFNVPFTAVRKRADDPLGWIDLTDSGDESSGNDGVVFLNTNRKENMETVYSL